MKKTPVYLIAFILFSLCASAQLKGTSWKGTLNIPQTTDCILEFKNDTLNLYVEADGSLVETMSYTVSKDTLTLLKLSGSSPCTGDTKGTYKVEMKEGKLYIKPLADDCQDRYAAFNQDAWVRKDK